MNTSGTDVKPLRVAIVGSGPSGFYAAEALLQSDLVVEVDMIERLPVPYGLVRHGVAPDHPKLKEVVNIYAGIARHPRFAFFGNVCAGKDVTMHELAENYHAVIIACGAGADRKLGIPGEDLAGVHSATDFVSWYNGHPYFSSHRFDFSSEVAVIIGQGNVSIDVCRILSKSVDELRKTDIAEHALDALAASHIREVHLVGRRCPAQAKFTNKELRELGELTICDPVVDPGDLQMNDVSAIELTDPHNMISAKNIAIFQNFAGRPGSKIRRCYLHFLLSPQELQGRQRLERVVFAKNRLSGEAHHQEAIPTSETVAIDAGLLFRSIGYKGTPLPGLPFDERAGIIPNRDGRIVTDSYSGHARMYATGWIKRGPTGIIGTNRADSVATVSTLLADLPYFQDCQKRGREGLASLLDGRGVQVIDFEGWQNIDAEEKKRGAEKDKPREKFVSIEQMLAASGPCRQKFDPAEAKQQ